MIVTRKTAKINTPKECEAAVFYADGRPANVLSRGRVYLLGDGSTRSMSPAELDCYWRDAVPAKSFSAKERRMIRGAGFVVL